MPEGVRLVHCLRDQLQELRNYGGMPLAGALRETHDQGFVLEFVERFLLEMQVLVGDVLVVVGLELNALLFQYLTQFLVPQLHTRG